MTPWGHQVWPYKGPCVNWCLTLSGDLGCGGRWGYFRQTVSWVDATGKGQAAWGVGHCRGDKENNNYVNPVCSVATVFHQVRSCTFSQVKSINMFPWFCNMEFLDISFGDWLRFEHRTSLFSCFTIDECQYWPQTLAAICSNMGIWDLFVLRPPGKIYLGFEALHTHTP